MRREWELEDLGPDLRARLAHLGGPELGTRALERLMREINARTDIGARPLEHPLNSAA